MGCSRAYLMKFAFGAAPRARSGSVPRTSRKRAGWSPMAPSNRAKRRRQRILLSVILGSSCIAGCARHRAATLPGHERPIDIQHVVTAGFTRVEGPATGGAVLDVGAAGSWNAKRIGLPSVVFDGVVYRMWFDGTPIRAPEESPYLYRSAIGLA